MMSKRMRDSLPYLQILAKCKPKVRKVLIEHGPSNLVLSICECCHMQRLKRDSSLDEEAETTFVTIQETP